MFAQVQVSMQHNILTCVNESYMHSA